MPNRVLRDWTTSEKMDKLSFEAEVLFTRLIMKADDHGCFHANLKLLNAAVFPLKDISTGMLKIYLQELVDAERVHLYQVDGREYLQITDFGQRLRTMNSKFPLPDSKPLTDDSNRPPETKRNEDRKGSRNEDECNLSIFGKYGNFFTVQKKYISDRFCKVFFDGITEYMEVNNSVLRSPEKAKAFFEKKNGAQFSDFMHFFNTYNKFLDEQPRKNTNSAEVIGDKHYSGL
jgi:hypothetical protein